MSVGIDLFAAEFRADPHPAYATLRQSAPVLHHPQDFWVVSRYADVAALQRSPHSVEETSLRIVPAFKSDTARLGAQNRMMHGLSVLDRDPPDHHRLRRLLAGPFTRGAIAARADRIQRMVYSALDDVAAAGTIDLMPEVIFGLPFTLISEIIGLPAVDVDAVRRHTAVLTLGLEPLPEPGVQQQIRAANDQLTEIIGDAVRRKRAHPADDLLSELITAEREGVLDEAELVAQVMLVFIAGHETTVNLIGSGVATLLAHPEAAELLRHRPGLMANAVEEILRFEPSVHLMRRITLGPLEIGQTVVPDGALVIGAVAAANRDPDFWGSDAEYFRPDRALAPRHLSFGAGVHHCLGAALARAEATAFLRAFVQRFPRARLCSSDWNGRINVRGPASMVVSVD